MFTFTRQFVPVLAGLLLGAACPFAPPAGKAMPTTQTCTENEKLVGGAWGTPLDEDTQLILIFKPEGTFDGGIINGKKQLLKALSGRYTFRDDTLKLDLDGKEFNEKVNWINSDEIITVDGKGSKTRWVRVSKKGN